MYLQWNSNHPLSAKLSVANTLCHRAELVCTAPEAKEAEYAHIKEGLSRNGYPAWVLSRSRNRASKLSPTPNVLINRNTGDHSKKSKAFAVTPYVKGMSEKMRDTMRNKGVQLYFKGGDTVRSLLMAPKDKDPKPKKQGVIYDFKCNIPECKSRYIGETKRMLEERYDEHRKRDNSALKLHQDSCEHPLPDINDKSLRIIDTESNWSKRKILEAAYIKANDPNLNANIGHYELSNIYTSLIKSKEGGFIV